MRFNCRFFGPTRKLSVGEFADDTEEYFRISLPLAGGFAERILCAGPDNDPGDLVLPDLANLRSAIVKNIFVSKHPIRSAIGPYD